MFVHAISVKSVMWFAIAALVLAPVAAARAHAQKTASVSDSAAAVAGKDAAKANPNQPVLRQRQNYEIEPGDVLEISFPLTPSYNQTVTVTPDGFLSLRGADDVLAKDQTVPQLRASLREAFSKNLHDPIVYITLKNFRAAYFIVGGQVAHPGKYDLRGNVTVAEALAIAGGTVPGSKIKQVLLFRPMPGGSMIRVRKLNMKRMLSKGNLREDSYLQPGDMVYVPKTRFSNVQRFLPTSSLGVYAPGFP